MKALHIRSLYLLTGLLLIVAIILHLAGWQTQFAHYILKPLLMPLLMWYALKTSSEKGKTVTPVLLIGLFLSWIGDVTLMMGTIPRFSEYAQLWFLAGLAAFLLTHVCYIFIFLADARNNDQPSLLKMRPMLALPVVLLYLGLMLFIVPGLAFEMMFPVLLYGAVITTMVITAINRAGKVPPASYAMVRAGAILLFTSDAIIALSRFYKPFSIAPVLIMSTYILAQYLIVQGVCEGNTEVTK
jgi:uncharacterized membrane protein YhhN